ncbi:MAG: tol-pal system protein YbgF [Rhodoferax sp.]
MNAPRWIPWRGASLAAVLCLAALAWPARAALFEDDEARRAILDLRQTVQQLQGQVAQARAEAQQAREGASDGTNAMGRSLLELQRQIELLRAEIASLRGQQEQLARDVSLLQQQRQDELKRAQALQDRLAALEPSKVSVDGVEFSAEPAERRAFESALAVFRRGDFVSAQAGFAAFVSRYPSSGYVPSALFWLGNAQYATRDYKEAIANFRTLVGTYPNHQRTPEAVLSIANCQLELKDIKSAKKTLADLIKGYPNTEAATAARERLAALK